MQLCTFQPSVHLNSWRIYLCFMFDIWFYLYFYLSEENKFLIYGFTWISVRSALLRRIFFFVTKISRYRQSNQYCFGCSSWMCLNFRSTTHIQWKRKRNAQKQLMSKYFNLSFFPLTISVSSKSMCTVRSGFYEYNGMDGGDVQTGSLCVCVLVD